MAQFWYSTASFCLASHDKLVSISMPCGIFLNQFVFCYGWCKGPSSINNLMVFSSWRSGKHAPCGVTCSGCNCSKLQRLCSTACSVNWFLLYRGSLLKTPQFHQLSVFWHWTSHYFAWSLISYMFKVYQKNTTINSFEVFDRVFLDYLPGRLAPYRTYLWMEGQLIWVFGVHHGRVGVKNEVLPGGSTGSRCHGNQQVHHLYG